MSRYVNADIICLAADETISETTSSTLIAIAQGVKDMVNRMNGIEIVRCRECVFDTDYYFKNDVKEHRHEWCYEFCDVDGYCPFGKKQSEREGV